MRRGLSALACLVVSLALVVGHGEKACADGVPAMQQSLLFLRVLAYDRSLKQRAGDGLTVAVVRRAHHAQSEQVAGEIAAALDDVARRSTVSGLHLRTVVIDFKDAASFESALTAEHAAALYVSAGLEESLTAISAVARRRHALSGCGNEGLVRGGLSIGLVERDGHPALLINLPASRAEGADLDAAVLRLAEVIR